MWCVSQALARADVPQANALLATVQRISGSSSLHRQRTVEHKLTPRGSSAAAAVEMRPGTTPRAECEKRLAGLKASARQVRFFRLDMGMLVDCCARLVCQPCTNDVHLHCMRDPGRILALLFIIHA